MGQGGKINLSNATPYVWRKTSSYNGGGNMTWDFPDTIGPGTSTSRYVEFSGTYSNLGIVCYTIEDHKPPNPNSVFLIQATDSPYDIKVVFVALNAQSHPQGSTMDLGWKHDGKWLHQNLDYLGGKRLKDICFGIQSHDAGMSEWNRGTPFGTRGRTLTQYTSIGNQLMYGVRFFDIRPVISGGIFATGHYSDITAVGWQGATGQSFDDIITQIDTFTTTYAELVVLDFGGSLNTDVGRSYREFNQDEWKSLLQKLSQLKHLFTPPATMGRDLTKEKLTDFIGQGRAAVLCLFDSKVNLKEYANKGFFVNRFPETGGYSNTNVPQNMTTSQLSLLRKTRTKKDSFFFNLFWTLTQQTIDDDTILTLANKVRDSLAPSVLPIVKTDVYCYPNIFSLDGIDGNMGTMLALAINRQLHGSTKTLVTPERTTAMKVDAPRQVNTIENAISPPRSLAGKDFAQVSSVDANAVKRVKV